MASPNTTSQTITISTATIFKVGAAILIVWLVYVTADILLLVLASVFLAAAVRPWVDALQKYHLPRSVSMLGIYAILFAVLSSAIVLIVPPVIEEAKTLTEAFPDLYGRFIVWLGNVAPGVNTFAPEQAFPQISSALTSATQGVLTTLVTIFGGIFSFFMVLVMTLYLVVDEKAIDRTVAIFPSAYQQYLASLYLRLQDKIGRWLRAQLIIMALVGLLVYAVLTIFQMHYALLLALFAGIAEFIPYLGPIIGAVPAVLLASAISPTLAIVIAIAYYGIQLFENNVLTPKIMERAVGLSPILSITVFFVGAKIGGITGAFLAIPVATAVSVVMKEVLNKETRKSMRSTTV
ncbi:MAG: AI-2E family transporter [Patescibacteria group bacterium]|jgi:predicted PurR-regulated permease PerM